MFMSEKVWFSFHTLYTSVLVASYLQQKSIILFNSIALFACVRLWATPSSTGDACNKDHATHGVQCPCAKPHALCIRDVRWPKFVGMGTERNAFPFKKDLSLSRFFRFFSFLERVFPLFPVFLWISNPVFRRSFPVFSSFHLSKPVPCF